VHRRQNLDRLDFQHERLRNQQVNALLREELTSIPDLKAPFPLERNPFDPQFDRDCAGVTDLPEPGAESSMNLEAAPDRLERQCLEFVR